ncbi:MAG: hypothetical protein ACOX5Z_10485 [Desulfobulbus sp.]|jgi:glutamate dehydrogenase (NADP+)
METILQRDPGEEQFQMQVREFLETIVPVIERHPEYRRQSILERIIEPERVVMFRVQMNSAIGPYRGGLRFHPLVCLFDHQGLGL